MSENTKTNNNGWGVARMTFKLSDVQIEVLVNYDPECKAFYAPDITGESDLGRADDYDRTKIGVFKTKVTHLPTGLTTIRGTLDMALAILAMKHQEIYGDGSQNSSKRAIRI